MDFLPVLNKRDFVRRYRDGEFGNASPTWDSVEGFLSDKASTTSDLFHLRNRVRSGPTYYDVPGDLVDITLRKALAEGVKESDLYVSQMAPTALTTLQGEIQQTPDGLYLYYTRVKKPMRDALRESAHEARGIIALEMLRAAFTVGDFEWMGVLLDRYPDHVLEFSTYSKAYGTIPGCRVVWWEVRSY